MMTATIKTHVSRKKWNMLCKRSSVLYKNDSPRQRYFDHDSSLDERQVEANVLSISYLYSLIGRNSASHRVMQVPFLSLHFFTHLEKEQTKSSLLYLLFRLLWAGTLTSSWSTFARGTRTRVSTLAIVTESKWCNESKLLIKDHHHQHWLTCL